MENLSFDLNDKKDFSFFGKNDFSDPPIGEVHYLFSNYDFLFWVITTDGKVTSVMEIDRNEVETFELDEPMTDERYAVHVKDAEILNQPEYIEKLQVMVDKL